MKFCNSLVVLTLYQIILRSDVEFSLIGILLETLLHDIFVLPHDAQVTLYQGVSQDLCVILNLMVTLLNSI